MRINVFLQGLLSPVAIKGSVALKHTQHSAKMQGPAHTWDEQYALRPLSWKGPYDLAPIVQYIDSGASMLDVGCGTGRYAVPLDRVGFDVVGIDLSQIALRSLPPHLACVVGDVQTLPFEAKSFDALTCYGVLQHLRDKERVNAVAELFRVLRDGGIAFVEAVGTRDMRYGSGIQEEESTFVREGMRCHYFSALELSQLFVTSGFTILDVKDRLAKKRYYEVEQTRHRISLIARRR